MNFSTSIFLFSTVLLGANSACIKPRSLRALQANKVDICHFDEEDSTWNTISVSANGNAVTAHKNHGDFVCGENSLECNASLGCMCVDGYEFEGEDGCVDIDECSTGVDNCDANASCTNSVGSFDCECDAGYSGDGETCVDIDECASATCDPNASCTDLVNAFSCDCNTGYSLDGETCVDIDDCASGPCGDNSSCTDLVNDFSCECNTGYSLDGETCVDIDNISECIDGFKLSEDGEECIEVEIAGLIYRREIIRFFFETCDGITHAHSNSPHLLEVSAGVSGSHTIDLDGPARVIDEYDMYLLFSTTSFFTNIETLTLTANGSDGWCISKLVMEKSYPGYVRLYDFSSAFWIDKPCTSTHYQGIPCYEQKIFDVSGYLREAPQFP